MTKQEQIESFKESIETTKQKIIEHALNDIIEVLTTLGDEEELIHLNYCMESLTDNNLKHIKDDEYRIFNAKARIDYESMDYGAIMFDSAGNISFNEDKLFSIPCNHNINFKHIVTAILLNHEHYKLLLEKVQLYLADNVKKDSMDWDEFEKVKNPCGEVGINDPIFDGSSCINPMKLSPTKIGTAINTGKDGYVDVKVGSGLICQMKTVKVNKKVKKGQTVYTSDIEGIQK